MHPHDLTRRALLAALTLVLCVAPVAAERLKLRILGTTDLHMNVLNWDYYQEKATDEYGLAKTATWIRSPLSNKRLLAFSVRAALIKVAVLARPYSSVAFSW